MDRLDDDLELLDTPGILWPKFEDEAVGFRLAVTGAVNDEVFDHEEAALKLVAFLQKQYPKLLKERFKLDDTVLAKEEPLAILEQIGRNRGCLLRGGRIDYGKVSKGILIDFRQAQNWPYYLGVAYVSGKSTNYFTGKNDGIIGCAAFEQLCGALAGVLANTVGYIGAHCLLSEQLVSRPRLFG